MKRVTSWEWLMALLLVFIGYSGFESGEMNRWGVPILHPRLYGGALVLIGICIPIACWLYRSRMQDRNDEEK